ncbi:hypothetical protein BH23ACT12_BH23ACT12_24150 [soil metagenome]
MTHHGVDAEAVAERALQSRSVSGLYPGGAVEVATYLPGKRISGVRVREDEVEIHVVARWASPLTEVAEEVRSLVSPLAGGLPVSVYIDDVDSPA